MDQLAPDKRAWYHYHRIDLLWQKNTGEAMSLLPPQRVEMNGS
jgi:hypothetical protein